MAEHEKELHVTVMYRGKPLQLKALAGSTLGDLGREIVDLTGVAPHTLRLMLPKRPPLLPMSEQHSANLLYQSGITEGMRMVMMGSSSAEVAAVTQPLKNERIIGFSEEDQRARQRSGHTAGSVALPKGNYIFCDFQTLRLPGIELNPPAAMALKIMHKLASDRGVTAIMNKYRWRVGIMTEMAPIGYVGVSPKCILGFNKNRGQEISLRLRTDDLKGFRKYESIKKTLLHELAHMVHDEHDEKFHALDKKLNEEAIALDWTKSQGHILSGVKYEDEEDIFEAGSSVGSRGYKVGGRVEHFVDARAAAAAAALRRFGDVGKQPSMGESSQTTVSVAKPTVHAEPDPDEQCSDVAVANSPEHIPVRSGEPDPDEAPRERLERKEPDPDEVHRERLERKEPDPDEVPRERLERNEPDPDEALDEHGVNKVSDSEAMSIVMDAPFRSQEPDPDEASSAYSKDEPDPDESMETSTGALERIENAHVEEAVNNTAHFPSRRSEPDPDSSAHSKDEPDPDESMETSLGALERTENAHVDEAVNNTADFPSRQNEPDPDEASCYRLGNSEPDPDEAAVLPVDHLLKSHEPDLDGAFSGCSCRDGPDPNESVNILVDTPGRRQELYHPSAFGGQSCINEPDPDEVVDNLLDKPVRKQEPDPDEASADHVCRNEPDPDEAVEVFPDIPLNRQEPDPDEGVEAILESPARRGEEDLDLLSSSHSGKDDADTVHLHNKSTGERGLDECVGCGRVAGKRMKSSSGGAFREMGEPQMSR